MFWKRKKEEAETVIVVSQLGEFAWEYSHAWYCKHRLGNSNLNLTYIGPVFRLSDLGRFERALRSVESLVATALDAVEDEIEHYDHSGEQMKLFGICVDPEEEDEDFQLEFNFSNWPDGSLTVHFKDEKVLYSSVDD